MRSICRSSGGGTASGSSFGQARLTTKSKQALIVARCWTNRDNSGPGISCDLAQTTTPESASKLRPCWVRISTSCGVTGQLLFENGTGRWTHFALLRPIGANAKVTSPAKANARELAAVRRGRGADEVTDN